jgi:hypothetical protein
LHLSSIGFMRGSHLVECFGLDLPAITK